MTLNNIKTALFFIAFLSKSIILFAQETITSGRLNITILNNGNGMEIQSIKDNATELLNTTVNPALFTLLIHNSTTNTDETITALSNWGNSTITNNGDNGIITLRNPTNANIASSLVATVTITTENEKSSWDLSVTGLGNNCSLLDIVFPQLNIKADGNDTFFYPLYSGQLTNNPSTAINYTNRVYPRGWGTTMQFFSYYNTNYGMYFGFHDPNASLKLFDIENENGGIKIQCTTPAINKTVNGNDWEMPGNFELDLYNGTWYDAALLYKEWVSSSANYWPTESANRTARQHSVGDIGVWLTNYIAIDGTPAQNQVFIQRALNFYDFPVGWHIYEWNNYQMDHFFPRYFPETNGLDDMVTNIQNANEDRVVVMPYINGRIWDTGLGGGDAGDAEAVTYFNNEGFADAVKNSDGSYREESGHFGGNTWAVMCPTQTNWQSIITDATDQITRDTRIGSKAVYIDMIAASAAVECMSPTHGHTIGGGSYWRDGYVQMLQNIHNTLPEDRFITAEGGCDFLADEIDAFMIQGWQTRNQVPAWQAIYTGKVQLFGALTGSSNAWYGSQDFYGILSQSFAYGVQTGRQSLFLPIGSDATPQKQMAANYTRSLGRMRYKLRDFMSYGEMKRPIDITGTIPSITYQVVDWGGARATLTITNQAIRKTVWQHANEVIVLFANGRVQSPAGVESGNVNFSFNFNPADYRLTGNLTIQELTPTTEGNIEAVNGNTFPKDVSLPNLGIIAYKITAEGVLSVDPQERLPSLMIYPNPSKDIFTIDYIDKIENVKIYNTIGQLVLETVPENKRVSITSISKGVYFISLKSKDRKFTIKLIKE